MTATMYFKNNSALPYKSYLHSLQIPCCSKLKAVECLDCLRTKGRWDKTFFKSFQIISFLGS